MTSSDDVMTLSVTLLLLTQVVITTSVFQSSSGVASEFHLAEEMPAATLVGSVRDNPQLQRIDSNGSNSFRFAMRHGRTRAPDGEHFSLDEQTGQIRTRKPIDREQVCLPATRSCSIVFDVIVRPLRYFQIVRVIVYIEDINDNAPTFPQQQLSLRIKESTLPGSTFPLPVATDADSGEFGIHGFELTSSSADLFALEVRRNVEESFDVRLELTGTLDRELVRAHELSVVAFDGGQPRRSGTLSIHVSVTDANDHSPQLASHSYEVEIVENELPSSAIVRVDATDVDDGQNAELVYGLDEFSEVEHGDVFRVDPVTGEVFLRRALDREVQSVYRLTVSVSDGGVPSLSAFTRVVVRVVDDNDNAPRVVLSSASADRRLSVVENSEPGTFIAYVSATDDDLASAATVDCYVAGRDELRLEPLYDGAQSEYKLLSAASFDRELQSSVIATLTCVDRGHPRSRSVDVQLVVEVTDDNDHAPVIARDLYQVDMAEGNQLGAEVVHINASDADSGLNAQLSFSLTRVRGTPQRTLSIDEKTGLVSVDVMLDFETCRLYEYIVSVSDAGDVPRTSTASLIVHVTDVDDERPRFDRGHYYFNVLEDVPVGTVLGRVVATDSDRTPAFGTVSYHIRRERAPFSIDRTSGEIVTVGQLDREERSVYELTVIASDTSHMDTTLAVTVHVQDVNDNAPLIVSPQQRRDSQPSCVIVVPPHLPRGHLLTR